MRLRLSTRAVLSMERSLMQLLSMVDKYKAKSAKPIHIITRFGATSALADEEYLKEAISNLVDNATDRKSTRLNSSH